MLIFGLVNYTLQRLGSLAQQAGEPQYEPLTEEVWGSRAPALTMLKVLLCRTNRRASRGELIEAIWPANAAIDAEHALDSAASVLRRRVLRLPEGGSLLLTIRSSGELIFKLP